RHGDEAHPAQSRRQARGHRGPRGLPRLRHVGLRHRLHHHGRRRLPDGLNSFPQRHSTPEGNAMQDRYLRTGIFLAPFHALGENPTLAIERDMELVEHLDRLNYHEAWIGEHHSGGFEIIACPEMFLAAAAQRTRNIRLGTGVVSLPYHHPFTLASRMMQLDHMTRGRAMFGVGPGSLIYDAEKIGLKAADQRRRMAESLDCLMELMQGRTVNRKTDWFALNEARLQLVPY